MVGVGSVGTRAWIVLLLGRDADDPLILQFKEAGSSVLEPYVGASQYDQGGHRVVAGQRLMQATSDIFLGWYRGKGVDGSRPVFYVRQLRDGKGSIDVAAMDPGDVARVRRAVRLDPRARPRPLRRPGRASRRTSATATRSTRRW